LAIHSVVVQEEYRNQGIAKAMMQDYIEAMKLMDDGVEKLVLLAKSDLLGFYVQCGFSVVAPSAIVHGKDVWYDCELKLDKSEQEGYPCWILDSFAEKAGSGNPAAVVLLPSGTDIDNQDTIAWMQVVAKEFNLPETAFIWPMDTDESVVQEVDGEKHGDEDKSDEEQETDNGQLVTYNIRYFTCNGTHVDLCGHATLASAAILFQTLPFKIKNDASIVFEAKKDLLKVTPYVEGNHMWRRNGSSIKVKMDFPKKSLIEMTAAADRSAVLSMLKAAFHMEQTAEHILYLGVDEDGGDLLIELTRDGFFNLGYDNINYSALMEWDGYSRGVILCCREPPPSHEEHEEAEEEHEEVVDFLSRFFGPKAGINEDPVTGSAHCTLAPYFANKLNKSTLIGKQTSERGGMVQCVVEEERVSIIGTAITTMRGSLCI
jgi:predicted PhzF superfamily epimerase YddE/YHI9